MKRGAVVIAAVKQTRSGTPMPFVVVQGDWTLEACATVTLCPITTDALGVGRIRIPVQASPESGLLQDGEVQVDRVTTVRRASIDKVIGSLPGEVMRRVDRSLKNWLDL